MKERPDRAKCPRRLALPNCSVPRPSIALTPPRACSPSPTTNLPTIPHPYISADFSRVTRVARQTRFRHDKNGVANRSRGWAGLTPRYVWMLCPRVHRWWERLVTYLPPLGLYRCNRDHHTRLSPLSSPPLDPHPRRHYHHRRPRYLHHITALHTRRTGVTAISCPAGEP